MSKFLTTSTEVYRVDTEQEATALIDEYKKKYDLIKYNCEYKEVKVNGEVESFYKLNLTTNWNNIKEPLDNIKVSYEAQR